MKRKFRIVATKTVIVELDDAVFKTVDDEWRDTFYNLHDDEDIAAHITFNLLQDRTLDRLDGWADQPKENACIVEVEDEDFDVVEL